MNSATGSGLTFFKCMTDGALCDNTLSQSITVKDSNNVVLNPFISCKGILSSGKCTNTITNYQKVTIDCEGVLASLCINLLNTGKTALTDSTTQYSYINCRSSYGCSNTCTSTFQCLVDCDSSTNCIYN